MYINIYLIISVAIVFTISLYTIFNLYRKNSIYETWIFETNDSMKDILDKWQAIDSKQMFEKDDEVGVVYEDINELIKEIETRTTYNGQ
jgi:hypothetical protein